MIYCTLKNVSIGTITVIQEERGLITDVLGLNSILLNLNGCYGPLEVGNNKL